MYFNGASIGVLTNLDKWIVFQRKSGDRVAVTLLSGMRERNGETISDTLDIILSLTMQSPAGSVICKARHELSRIKDQDNDMDIDT
jgi:hypothetical protein